jgi:hypothetical protein
MCGDDRGWRPAPHIGEDWTPTHQPVVFVAAGEGAKRTVPGHGTASARAPRANTCARSLPSWVRREFPFVTADRPTPNLPQPCRRFVLRKRCTQSAVEEWARGRRPRTLANLFMHPDSHGHAKAWKQRTPSAASTLLEPQKMCASASQLNLRAEVRARASWLEAGTSNSTRFHLQPLHPLQGGDPTPDRFHPKPAAAHRVGACASQSATAWWRIRVARSGCRGPIFYFHSSFTATAC